MRNKLFKLLFLLLIVVAGCSLIKNSDNNCKDISELKTIHESVYLNDSIKIACFPNYHFTPLGINDNDILICCLINEADNKKSIGLYDLETKSSKIIKNLDSNSQYAGIYLLDVSNEYVAFVETDNLSEYRSKVYVYSFSNDDYVLIYEQIDGRILTTIEGVLYNDVLFFNHLKNNVYVTEYLNLKNNGNKVVIDENSSAPIIVNEKLYYISINSEEMVTSLISNNIDGSNKTKIMSRNQEEGWIHHIKSHGNIIYIFTVHKDKDQQPYTICSKFDVLTNKMDDLFQTKGIIDSPIVNKNCITWWNPNDTLNRTHTKYSLYDIESNSMVDYQDSVIMLSNNGILWTKFNKNEADIPKGEIFIGDNSSIMYKK